MFVKEIVKKSLTLNNVASIHVYLKIKCCYIGKEARNSVSHNEGKKDSRGRSRDYRDAGISRQFKIAI